MKPQHVAQFRLTGPTEGLRKLRECPGEHRWLLRIRLIEANGNERYEDIRTAQPCAQHHISHIYEQSVNDICASENGAVVQVKAGGFDLYRLPAPTSRANKPHRLKTENRRA